MGQRRYYFSTRDLLMMAALAALGGVTSTYVNAIGDLFQSVTGFGGTTQWAAGLHVMWLTLAVGLTRKQGAGTITGLLKGGVELLTGNHARQVNEMAQAGGSIPENAALKITGLVESEIGWTEDKIRSMDTMDAESTNSKGETETNTGVALNDLLGKAGPASEATTLVLIADDGYSAEVALAEVQACEDCILSFRNQGGFSTVLPGFPGNVQVTGIFEIQVK